MMPFRFTNFASSVDKGQSLSKISKGIGSLNGHVVLKRPLGVDFREQVEDRYSVKTYLPLMGGRAVFLSKRDVLNPKGANRRFLWFLFRPSREVLTVASCPLVRKQEVPCHRCRPAGYAQRAPSSR